MLLGAKDRATPTTETESENYACMGSYARGRSGRRRTRATLKKCGLRYPPQKHLSPFKRLTVQREEFLAARFAYAIKYAGKEHDKKVRARLSLWFCSLHQHQ